MAGEVARRTTAKTGAQSGASAARKSEVIEALGVEQGVDVAFSTVGSFQSLHMAGIIQNRDEELREVLRLMGEDAGPTVRQLVAMRRMDGQARALYRLLTLPIRAALRTATIVATDEGEDERDFIDDVFNLPPESGGMSVTFSRFMGQLLQGIFDGFAAFEKVYWVPEEGPLRGKITLKKLAHRPSETVTFVVDKTGGFAGLRQRTVYYGQTIDVFIPRNRAFYYAAQEEEQKFYGVSFFQSAFYHYDMKARLYYASHLAANRSAVGTRLGTVPAGANKESKAEFARMLANLSMAQWMAMPEGFKVDVLKEGGNYDFLAQINHHNSQMSKSVLAQFFDKDQGAGAGDASLVSFGQPGDEMFNLMLRAIQQDIAEQINHYIIPPLIDFNFKSGKYPKFAWGSLTDEQNAAIAATFDKIANQQTLTPEFIRALEEHQAREFGLDIDYEEIDMREEEEAEAAAALGEGELQDPNAAPAALPGEPGAAPDAFGGAPAGPAPAAPAGGAPAAPEGGAPVESSGAAPEGGVESPQVWASLDDFEAAIEGIDDEEPEEEEDFEEQLALSALDDFENLLDIEPDIEEFEMNLSQRGREEKNLLTMAQSLLDAAEEAQHA